MKKLFGIMMLVLVISLAACSQNAPEINGPTAGNAQASADSAVDSMGSDMSNVANEEKDLSSDNLNGIDQGLADIENI